MTRIIQDCYQRAEKILMGHMEELHLLAKTLLERETLDGEEMRKLFSGEDLPPLTDSKTNGTGPHPEAAPAAEATRPATEAPTASGTTADTELPQAAASSQSPPEKKKVEPDAGGLFGTQS